MSQFTVSDENPNEVVGGGGCLGHGDAKSEDCHGPFVIFQTVETSSNLSPHAVLCYACLEQVAAKVFGPADEPVIDLPPEDITEEPDESIPEV